jgi:hypothetical protein
MAEVKEEKKEEIKCSHTWQRPTPGYKKITQRIHRNADLRDYAFGQTVLRKFRTPLLNEGAWTLTWT